MAIVVLSQESWSAISRRRRPGHEQLLSRPADARPMEGLAEWKLADGGWIQVFQDKDRAGSSSVTYLVSAPDDQPAELKAKGISIERTPPHQTT